MKILVLAWEFPPRLVGGIARHVAELYPEIVNFGHEVHLLTVESPEAPPREIVEGIDVHRLPVPPGKNFLNWVGNLNEVMGRYGGELLATHGDFDLIHGHDWLVGDAAIALKHRFHIPLVATIHATEHGRFNGIHNATNDYISGKEKDFATEAWRVIVCSQYMSQEVNQALEIPLNKVNIVFNGIRPEKKTQQHFDRQEFRRRFAQDHEKIVYYVGRMAYEKGVAVLLNAAAQILETYAQPVKFVIIGGGNTEHLKQQARELGIQDSCKFTGFMPDDDLDKFQTIADCAVFPSLYEPFGIVALESFASRVPVVVSNAGGLPEVVKHNHTGIVTESNNPQSLGQGILTVLQNPEKCQTLTENAYRSLQAHFNWPDLAEQTLDIFRQILQERRSVDW